MPKFTNSIFFKPKNKALASKITIKSPEGFRESIRELRKDGLTLKEKRALVLARTRAKAILMRTNLSLKERREFTEISETRIPKITRRK